MVKNNFSLDDFLASLYKPLNRNAETAWKKKLLQLSKNSLLYRVAIKLGNAVPRKCWISTKLKLNWTFCKLNPFFKYLMVLNNWALQEKEAKQMNKILKKLYSKQANKAS